MLDALLGALDEASPGLIRDAYITGSIPLGDGRPGQSDIDVVLVSVTPAGYEALRPRNSA